MKWNVYYTMANMRTGHHIEVPNKPQPVEATDLASLLSRLATNLPAYPLLDVEITGIRVKLIHEPTTLLEAPL